MEYTIKSTKGDNIKYTIRKAIKNKKQWVVEVYFDNQSYPNIISGRFLTLKNARNTISIYQNTKKFSFWGDL